jgi:hypothetical protein
MDEVASLNEAESGFQKALADNDLAGLDKVLDREVRFVGADGSIIGKGEDLAAHRSGQLVLSAVTELHREAQVIKGVGITRVTLHLTGMASGVPLAANVIYTRVWRRDPDGWFVIAAHGSAV